MFDYQGIFTLDQWNVLKTFVVNEKADILFRKTHLTAEKDRLRELRKNFFKADTAIDGTSLIGNAGDTGSAGTNRIISKGTVDAEAVKAELQPLDPPRYAANYTPTVMGGDKPWKDDPVTPDKLIISNSGANDASTAIITEDLKVWVLKQIKRRRERFEYKLKKINDKIEQIENEITQLDSVLVSTPEDLFNPYVEGRVNAVQGRFNSFIYKNKSLFLTAADTRLYPIVSDTFSDTGTTGEPSKSQSVISAETDAKTRSEVGPPKATQGFGKVGS